MLSGLAAVAAAEAAVGCRFDGEWLAPLLPDVERWSGHSQPRRPTLGPSGVLLSTHLTAQGTGPLRCDVDPLWEIDDPRHVHDLLDALLDATGQRSGAAPAHALLASTAWPPPGVGPGPYVGIGVDGGGVPSVRAWTPSVVLSPSAATILAAAGVKAALPSSLHTEAIAPFAVRFAGVEMADSRVSKVSLYLRGDAGSRLADAVALLTRMGIGSIGAAALELGQPASAARDERWLGVAVRLAAAASQWMPIVEIGWGGAGAAPLRACLQRLGWSRADAALQQLIGSGLSLWMVTVAGAADVPSWIAVYFAPRLHRIPDGRRVHVAPAVLEPIGVPDATGAQAQSVVDWRGAVHTASWTDGEPLRWRTIGARPPLS